MRATIALALALISAGSFAAEPGLTMDELRLRPWVEQSPLPREDRTKLLEMLDTFSRKYLSAVEAVNFDSFKGLNIPAPSIAALTGELEDVKTMMRENVALMQALQKDPDREPNWLLLARNFYRSLGYAEDLDRFEIVHSKDYIGVRTLMSVVFDRILLPEAHARAADGARQN
jgi:hypothetical protein